MDAYRRFINRELPREERSCTSKVQFVTRHEARSYLRGGRLTAGSPLRLYPCRFGEHWHLGHRRRRHASGGECPAAGARVCARVCGRVASPDDGPGWMSREWWSDRRRRHLRPARADRPWREAWGAAT